jgi:hypothetical protein
MGRRLEVGICGCWFGLSATSSKTQAFSVFLLCSPYTMAIQPHTAYLLGAHLLWFRHQNCLQGKKKGEEQ